MLYAEKLSLSIALFLLLLILSLLFRCAGILRLGLTMIYLLLISTVLKHWATAHETVALSILYILFALTMIRMLIDLKHFIQEKRYYKAMQEDMSWQITRAKEKGISLDSVYFDTAGNMRYCDTHEIVN